ncbi:hypothetical protein [Palleronia sp.]|uniref:hypothetical protein n=1 Tax=Palleronia sp. TaxID=1940284 RepID=UPI0035C7B1AC
MIEAPSDSENLSDQSFSKYLNAFERLARGIENRCELTGETPSLAMIPQQIALRSKLVAKSTIRFEISSARMTLKDAIGSGMWYPSIALFRWIADAEPRELTELSLSLQRTRLEICGLADDLIDELCGMAEQNDHDLDGDELLERVCRFEKRRSDRVVNRNHKALTWSDWHALEAALSEEDPIETLADLLQDKLSTPGLLRLFVAAMFMTGMRPVEVLSFSCMCPHPRHQFSPEDRALILSDPGEAIVRGLLIPVENAARHLGVDLGRAAHACRRQSNGGACVLLIHTAKRSNANADLRLDFRLQVVDTDAVRDLGLLSFASQIRHAKMSRRRWDSLRNGLVNLLKEVARREPALSRGEDEINLYSFRHAFADRMRNTLERLEEVAALTGHTSRTTLSGYGERGRKKGGGGRAPDGWAPRPCPKRVETIRAVWSGQLKQVDVGPVPERR